jgi:hypothetical protein
MVLPTNRFLYKRFVDPFATHLHIIMVLHKAKRITDTTWKIIPAYHNMGRAGDAIFL